MVSSVERKTRAAEDVKIVKLKLTNFNFDKFPGKKTICLLTALRDGWREMLEKKDENEGKKSLKVCLLIFI